MANLKYEFWVYGHSIWLELRACEAARGANAWCGRLKHWNSDAKNVKLSFTFFPIASQERFSPLQNQTVVEDRIVRSIILFLVLALVNSFTLAQTEITKVIIKEAEIQYEVPPGWRTQKQNDAMQITSPDGGVSIIVGLAVNDNVEAMIAGLKEYLRKDYQNFKVSGDLQKESINDLRALIENGTGETSEGVMEWNIVVIIGGKHSIIAFTVAEQKAFKNSQSDYIKWVQSIKKTN